MAIAHRNLQAGGDPNDPRHRAGRKSIPRDPESKVRAGAKTTKRRPYRTPAPYGARKLANADGLPCCECGVRKPLDAFRRLSSGALESYCRDCHNARNREWRARTKDEYNARRRAAYSARVRNIQP